MQDLQCPLARKMRPAGDLEDEGRLQELIQAQHHRDLFVRNPLLEDLVLGAVRGDLVMPVADLLAHLYQILSDFQDKTSLTV